MTESKKGHNFAIQGPTEKKICIRLFFVLMLYIKFKVPSSSGSLVLQPTKGVTDRQTDRRSDGQAQTNMSPQLLRSWGHKKLYDDQSDPIPANSDSFGVLTLFEIKYTSFPV